MLKAIYAASVWEDQVVVVKIKPVVQYYFINRSQAKYSNVSGNIAVEIPT